jgi:hypothetical protein
MEDLNVNLNLTVRQCNIVLQALGTRPYAEVAEVILAIKSQGDAVVAAAINASEVAPNEEAPAE